MKQMDRILKISKLDSTKRQLETAIRLYFSNGDPVSIHTLVSAAYNVIRDINANRGGQRLILKEQFLDYIKDGHEKEIREKINEAENFFKHADRDPDSTIDFNPGQSEFLIIEACSVYYKLTGEFPPLFKLYQIWFIVNRQELFNFPEELEQVISMRRQDIIRLGKEAYLNTFLPIIFRMNT